MIGGEKIVHQRFDLRFRVGAEIFRRVELAHAKAHRAERAKTVADAEIAAAHRGDARFQRTCCCAWPDKRFVMHVEIGVGEAFER